MIETTAACTEHPTEVAAVQWRTAYSITWAHGALVDPARPYSGPQKTLCGRRVGGLADASWTVDGGAGAVTCRACRKKLGLSGRGY